MIPAGQAEHEGAIPCHPRELAALNATFKQRPEVRDAVDTTACDFDAAHRFVLLDDVLEI